MSDQNADYELAFNELKDAWVRLGATDGFWKACDEVELRLSRDYPDDASAITEMIALWLVLLGAHPEATLIGTI